MMKFVRMRSQSDSATACLAMASGLGYNDAAMVLYEGGPSRPATQSLLLAALERAGIAASSRLGKVYGWQGVPQPSIVRTLLDPSDTWWHWVVYAQNLIFDPGMTAPIHPSHCWRPPVSFIALTKEKVSA